jgi:transcriptional regulator with XRE-family HTH domain
VTKKTSNAIDEHVGGRIRMRRKMLRLTQGKLANKLDGTFQHVQKYEKGINRLSASRLQRIANVLQVPVSFFFDRPPEIDASFAGVDPFLDPRLTRATSWRSHRAFNAIANPRVRAAIIAMVRDLGVDGLRGLGIKAEADRV